MYRTINPTAEIRNTESSAAGSPSEGNSSDPAGGGTSFQPRSDIPYIQLNFKPLTTESQIKERIMEEVEGNDDASTLTEQELSEERNGGVEAELDRETRILSQASEQEAIVIVLSSARMPTALPEAPEKEGKEDEMAPAPLLADKKESVVPQLPKEEESPEKKPSVPQPLPENEEKIPQLSVETVPSLPRSSLEMKPSLPQPLPESEQNVPQLSVEMEPSLLKREPSVPHSQVFKEPSLSQTSSETEPPVPHPQVFKEPSLPRTSETEPPVPHPQVFKEPSLSQTSSKTEPPAPHPQVFKEPSLPRTTSETEPPVPHPQVFKEPSLPRTASKTEPPVPHPHVLKEPSLSQISSKTEPPVPHPQVFKEPSLSQTSSETEPPVPHPQVFKEPSLPRTTSETEPPVPHPQVFKEPSLSQTSSETEPPVPHPQVFKEPSLPRTASKTEPPVPHPRVFKEPSLSRTTSEMVPPVPRMLKETSSHSLPPFRELITPRPPSVKEFLAPQSLSEKNYFSQSMAVQEHFALRGASPKRFERPASQEEKETVTQSETKACPKKDDTPTSVLAPPKAKPAAALPGGKGPSFNDTVEDLAAHLREVGHASKSAMASSISSFVASPVGQVFAHTIDRALEKSEEWLDYYLPVVETDVESSTAAEEEPGTTSEDLSKEGCFVRISALSTKLRNRAFQLALHQLKLTRQSTGETLPVLDQTLDVLDRTRGQNLPNIASIPEPLQSMRAQRGAKQDPSKSTQRLGTSTKMAPSIVSEQLELKALDLTRTLALQLYVTYHSLLPHITNLPVHLQQNVIRVYENMEELHSHFRSSPSLQNLPSSLVIQSRQKITAARENLDEILDFLAQNPAVNWLSKPASSTKSKQPMSTAAEKQPRGRSPEGKGREETSTEKQPRERSPEGKAGEESSTARRPPSPPRL